MTPIVEQPQRVLPPLARIVPPASVMAGSTLGALIPWIADAPLLPPFGLLMLLGWRLLRPELWQAWVALPLGAFDDLLSGQPMGSSMALWTAVFLVLDMTDNRAVWHDYWHDLLTATAAIAFCLLGGWGAMLLVGGGGGPLALLPQYVLSVLLMPLAMRTVARLDRFRLQR
jgi:rod shape-determining protein MreD